MVEEAAHVARHVERNELVKAPGGRRRASRFAEVRVPEVTSTLTPRCAIRSTMGRSERLSPMLAPWIHTSGPAGRARPG
jgi:hypothetical protein